MRYYTVYEVKNKVNGKTYRGKHETVNPYDGYLGSGELLQKAINKYGVENFEKFILYIFDNKEDMDRKEAELVNEEYLKSGKTYNLKLGGQGGFDYIRERSDFHNICIKGGKCGYQKTLKYWNEKKYWTDEIRKKKSIIAGNAFRGKAHTYETIKKMKESQKKINRFGENNPNFGKCWIYNDKESMKIKKDNLDEYLSQGWIKGRKIKFENLGS